MIHTYTARIKVCKDFYEQFLSHPSTKLYKERGSVHQTAKNGLLQEIGITLYGHKYSITYDRVTAAGATEQISYVNYVIDARVNPSKVIYREKSIDIYKPSDYSIFQDRFNQEIKSFNLPFLPDLEGWKAHRVDFTYNLQTPHVKEYIRLFHKSDLRGFTIKRDQHGHRSMKAGSLYINNSAVTLNFYDKMDEMQKAEGGSRHTPEEIHSKGRMAAVAGTGIFPQPQDMDLWRIEISEPAPIYWNGEIVTDKLVAFSSSVMNESNTTPRDGQPNPSISADESSEYANIMTPVETYAKEQKVKFIKGDRSFDEWDSYIEEINKMGDIQAAMDIYNSKISK